MPTTITPIYRYPLDGTGLNPNNLVVGEEHQLSTLPIRCVVPTYGGFFAESVKVKDTITDTTLVHGTDYIFGELFELPTGRYRKEIFGLIAITKPNVSKVTIDYQALGGDYSYSMDAIVAMINNIDFSNRPVGWGNIIGRPVLFNPAAHLHDLGDVYGFEYVVHSIERLRSAILMGDVVSDDEIRRYIDRVAAEQAAAIKAVLDSLEAHAGDTTNPHETTKEQVGLGNVGNYSVATQVQMDEAISNSVYLTPNTVAKYVFDKATTPLKAHIDDKDNPHNVTPAQLNVYTKIESLATFVKQGTGVDQLPNTEIHIGYSTEDKLKATVGTAHFGNIAMEKWVTDRFLDTSGVAAGTYGSSTKIPSFSVNAQGKLTAVSEVVIKPVWSDVTGKPTTLAGSSFTDVSIVSPTQNQLLVYDSSTARWKNTSGITGPMGPRGYTGDTGPQGPVGPMGPPGAYTGSGGYNWAKLPTGLVIQCGEFVTNAADYVTVYFPLSFPNAVLSIVCSEASATGWEAGKWATVYGVSPGRYGFDAFCRGILNDGTNQKGIGCKGFYVAIGY